MTDTHTPLVSICCLAYNHEKYIRDALDGFIMQKTDFPFEVLIHDDASTDGTANIIREYEAKYPKIIKPIYQTENQWSKGISPTFKYNFPRAKGKYIAICEGDDYWTDVKKLQSQYDYLENNSSISLVTHRHLIYIESLKEFKSDSIVELFSKNEEGILFDYDYSNKYWLTQPLSMMFRRSCLNMQIFSNYKLCRDTHLIYHLLKKGNGYCLNKIAGVFRKHVGGVNSTKSELHKTKIAYNIAKELYFHNTDDITLKNLYSYSIDNFIRAQIVFSKRILLSLFVFNLILEKKQLTKSFIQAGKLVIKILVNKL